MIEARSRGGDPQTAASRRIVARETAISIAINVAISAGMFVALFGLAGPAPVAGLGGYAADFVPQAFMIALMGSLVPGLIIAGKHRSHARLAFLGARGWRAIAVRSVTAALAAAILAGGSVAALLLWSGVPALAPRAALAVKMLFGGLIALATTPGAVRFALAGMPGDLPIAMNEAPYGHTH